MSCYTYIKRKKNINILNQNSTAPNFKRVMLNGFINMITVQNKFQNNEGGPRGRVVKVADFSALNHSIISPLWVRASLGARVTYGTSQVLLAGVSGGFSPGTPVFAHLPIDSSRYE